MIIMDTPERIIQLAYADLVSEVFLRIRNKNFNEDQLHDLADALHNISGILGNYGTWIGDKEYRRLYLKHFDTVWGSKGLALEAFLDERIKFHTEKGIYPKSDC
jgi:hypothetical protein